MQTGASRTETRITALGFRIGERLVPGLTLEMPIGHAELVQTDNQATAGRRPTGGYLGVGARWDTGITNRVRFLGRIEYTYYRFDLADDTDGEAYEIDWFRSSLLAGLGIEQGIWSAATGAGWETLEGDESVPSAGQANRVKVDGAGFGWIRAAVRTGRGESLAIRVEEGDRRGLWLSFRKGF